MIFLKIAYRLGPSSSVDPHIVEDSLKFACVYKYIMYVTKNLRIYYTSQVDTATCVKEMLQQLKSVRVHFAPGSKGRSFPLEYS